MEMLLNASGPPISYILTNYFLLISAIMLLFEIISWYTYLNDANAFTQMYICLKINDALINKMLIFKIIFRNTNWSELPEDSSESTRDNRPEVLIAFPGSHPIRVKLQLALDYGLSHYIIPHHQIRNQNAKIYDQRRRFACCRSIEEVLKQHSSLNILFE